MKLLILLFLVVSCSSMDRESCLATNWYDKGVRDGSSSGQDKFLQYQRECSQERISILSRSGEYKKGLIEGLRSWCTFQNGFNRGLDGYGGTVVCDNINPAFGRGYEEGYREYRIDQRRKRDTEEREKKYSGERDEFRRKMISRSDSKECAVDSDCHKDGDCRFNRCAHNNQYCSYSYECKVRGRCREITEYSREGERFSVRLCDYGGNRY